MLKENKNKKLNRPRKTRQYETLEMIWIVSTLGTLIFWAFIAFAIMSPSHEFAASGMLPLVLTNFVWALSSTLLFVSRLLGKDIKHV